MSAQAILLLTMLSALTGTLVGFCLGRQRGHAEGWLDHYFDGVRKDRARRNKLGQFTSTHT